MYISKKKEHGYKAKLLFTDTDSLNMKLKQISVMKTDFGKSKKMLFEMR